MADIEREVIRLLKNGQNLVLAAVMAVEGVSPRSAGAKMIIRQDGSIFATIGGGQAEAAVTEAARGLHAACQAGYEGPPPQPRILYLDLTGKSAASSTDSDDGMNCGERTDVLLDWVTARDLPVYEAAQSALDQQKKGWIVTALDQRSGTLTRQLGFIGKDGEVTGFFDEEVLFRAKNAAGGNQMHTEEVDGLRFLSTPIHTAGWVCLLGGGHVAREIAKIAHMTDFGTVVLDDRAEFVSAARFPESRRVVLESFEQIPELPVNENWYVVIVTRGHIHDQTCLRWALGTKAGYIGMIGSRRKREALYRNLRNEGVTQAVLDKLHSPIGLDIQSETPPEIAVSVVAELILARARNNAE
ncbi:MAG: XdhC family protein [Peptococcaceae bacterium]|jgi:xanthine dehydrogenase accessory factor|nr:XdhC family protein [Peptococcaceae bacterium]